MSHPLISVIVPVYNTSRYLAECVASVRAQTYRRWELILVDDGSTDGSGELCDRLAAGIRRARVIHRANGGLSAARNTGIMAAMGSLVTFVDSDDLLEPQMLARLLHIKERYRAGAAICATSRFDVTPPHRRTRRRAPRVYAVTAYKAVESILYQHRLTNSACGALYDASLLSPSTFREGILYEDLDAFYRILFGAGRVAVTDEPLYCYRRNPAGITGRFSERRLDVLDVVARLEDYMRVRHPGLSAAAASRRLSANFNMLGLMAANGVRRPEVERRCWEAIRRLRRRSLLDPRVRLKNKIGILASYAGGKRLVRMLSRLWYRPR